LGLADEIEASQAVLYRRSAATCTVGQILGYLSEEDGAALCSVLDDKRVFGSSIAELLNGYAPKVERAGAKAKVGPAGRSDSGHLAELCSIVTGATVQRHRRGKCLCGRGE